MGKHIETLSTAELVVFGKVCLERTQRLNVTILIPSTQGYVLEPIPLYIRCLSYQDFDLIVLSKYILNASIPHHYQYCRHWHTPMDNRLLFCLLVPSLANLKELVSRSAGYYH